MEYTIRQLAALTGVTTRTLRWYDQIDLLHPLRVGENGYRIYGGSQVDRLQHILFYRALGVELSQIRHLLDDPSFDRLEALRGHLTALQAERARVEGLIQTVEHTIQAEERNEVMQDQDKFEAFKKTAIAQNEAKYGKEIREKYGDETVEQANARLMGLAQEEYAAWTELEEELLTGLCAAVSAGTDPGGEEGRRLADLHRRWLAYRVPYTPEIHRGLAELYVADERFTAYYDSALPGCAQFLRDAVEHWVK